MDAKQPVTEDERSRYLETLQAAIPVLQHTGESGLLYDVFQVIVLDHLDRPEVQKVVLHGESYTLYTKHNGEFTPVDFTKNPDQGKEMNKVAQKLLEKGLLEEGKAFYFMGTVAIQKTES